MKRERRESAMKSTKNVLLATVLVGGLGLMFALAVAPVEAKPNKCDADSTAPGCGGGGGGGGNGGDAKGCKIDFDAVFDDDMAGVMAGVMSVGGKYIDGEERMSIGTGSGPGFRFDTNGGSQKLEGAGGVRVLKLTVPKTVPNFGSVDSGVDLRFDLSAGGLDLCSLEEKGATGEVGLNILFEDGASKKWIVKYSDVNGCGSWPVIVTRTEDTTWTIEGETACLVEYDDLSIMYPYLAMPFKMTITAQ